MDDDDPCRRFFLEPSQLLQRRYEVLRAFFVERRRQADIAAQFDLTPATVQSLVRDWRTQMQHGQVSPFLSSLDSDAPPAVPWLRLPRNRKHRLSATADRYVSPQDGDYARAWPASSCSYPCSPDSAWTNWYGRPAIPAPV